MLGLSLLMFKVVIMLGMLLEWTLCVYTSLDLQDMLVRDRLHPLGRGSRVMGRTHGHSAGWAVGLQGLVPKPKEDLQPHVGGGGCCLKAPMVMNSIFEDVPLLSTMDKGPDHLVQATCYLVRFCPPEMQLSSGEDSPAG